MKVKVGVITASTSNGATSPIDLTADGFSASEPLRAVILWSTGATAVERIRTSNRWSHGFGSNDGGSIQQAYLTGYSLDAIGTSDTARGLNTTAILKGFSAGSTPTVDYECDLTSFSDTGFTLTWTDAPANAIKVNYMAVGGSDVSAARVSTLTLGNAIATQNHTIAAGWGQPDLLFFTTHMHTALGDSTSHSRLNLGVAASDTARRCSWMQEGDAAATMNVATWQGNRALTTVLSSNVVDAEIDLSARGSWPTDGFQFSYPDQGGTLALVAYLAVKTTAPITIGSTTAPTAAAPQNQDISHGSSPQAALLWGVGSPATAGVLSSGGDLGGFFIGAWDGTDEVTDGVASKDADTTSSIGRWHSETKAIVQATPVGAIPGGAPALASEADASVSTTNLRLTWTTTDAVAREFNYLIIGASAAGSALTLDLDDTLSVVDGADTAFGKATSDPITLSDLALSGPGKAASDAVAVADASSRDFSAIRSDSVSVVDSASRQTATLASDSIGVADSAAPVLLTAYFVNPADTVTLADSARYDSTIAPSDNVPVIDEASSTFSRAIADAFAVADQIVIAVSKSNADPVTVSDSASTAQGREIATFDSLTVADQVRMDPSKVLSDPIPIADAIGWAFGKSQGDAVALGDSANVSSGLAAADVVALVDIATRSAGLVRIDTVSVLDTADPQLTAGGSDQQRTFSDSILVADSALKQVTKALTDTAVLTDTTNRDVTASVFSSVGVLDEVTLQAEYERLLEDILGLSDTTSVSHGLRLSLVSLVDVTDELVSTELVRIVVFELTDVLLPWPCPIDGGKMYLVGSGVGSSRRPVRVSGIELPRGVHRSRCVRCGFELTQPLH